MTLDQFVRAHLAAFAAREVGPQGNLACMKGICYVMRNRVRSGWHDSDWLAVIEHAGETAGNNTLTTGERLSAGNRIFQMLLRDIDDVYYSSGEDPTAAVIGKSLYYQAIDRPLNEWFVEHIVQDPKNHQRRAVIGSTVFYE